MANLENQDSGISWTTIVFIILVVLVIYLLWDAYVHEDPLTKVAASIDKGIDTIVDSTEEVVNTFIDGAGNVVYVVVDATGNVVYKIVGATGGVIGTVLGGAADLAVGAVNTTGDALIYAGEAIQIDENGEVVPKEVASGDVSEEEGRLAALRAAIDAGVVSSPMEGDMIKDLSGVTASEEGQDSEKLNVMINGGAEGVEEEAVGEVAGEAEEAKEAVTDEDGNTIENFYYYYDYPRYCTHCGGKGRYSCNNCVNCGYCITPDGYGECVSGDANGPYFREDCIAYEHSANGYRVYRHSPYRYLVGLPYWRRDGYYHDLRGYPRTKYIRRTGSHRRLRRLGSPERRRRVAAGSSGSGRAAARTRDVVIPTARSKSRSASLGTTGGRVVSYGRVSGPRGRAGAVRVSGMRGGSRGGSRGGRR